MLENKISLQISAEDQLAVKDAVQVIREKLGPVLIQLSPEDRMALTKMGDKSVSFVTKALEYMQLHSDLVPSYINTSEVEIDVKAVQDLRKILQDIMPLIDNINDTLMLSGSEAMTAALAFYAYIKGASNSKVPGSETIYNDLKSRFPSRRKKDSEE